MISLALVVAALVPVLPASGSMRGGPPWRLPTHPVGNAIGGPLLATPPRLQADPVKPDMDWTVGVMELRRAMYEVEAQINALFFHIDQDQQLSEIGPIFDKANQFVERASRLASRAATVKTKKGTLALYRLVLEEHLEVLRNLLAGGPEKWLVRYARLGPEARYIACKFDLGLAKITGGAGFINRISGFLCDCANSADQDVVQALSGTRLLSLLKKLACEAEHLQNQVKTAEKLLTMDEQVARSNPLGFRAKSPHWSLPGLFFAARLGEALVVLSLVDWRRLRRAESCLGGPRDDAALTLLKSQQLATNRQIWATSIVIRQARKPFASILPTTSRLVDQPGGSWLSQFILMQAQTDEFLLAEQRKEGNYLLALRCRAQALASNLFTEHQKALSNALKAAQTAGFEPEQLEIATRINQHCQTCILNLASLIKEAVVWHTISDGNLIVGHNFASSLLPLMRGLTDQFARFLKDLWSLQQAMAGRNRGGDDSGFGDTGPSASTAPTELAMGRLQIGADFTYWIDSAERDVVMKMIIYLEEPELSESLQFLELCIMLNHLHVPKTVARLPFTEGLGFVVQTERLGGIHRILAELLPKSPRHPNFQSYHSLFGQVFTATFWDCLPLDHSGRLQMTVEFESFMRLLDQVEVGLTWPDWVATVATEPGNVDCSPIISTEVDRGLIREICLMLRKLEELLCRALRGLAATGKHRTPPLSRAFYALLLRAYRLRQIQDYMLRVGREVIHLDFGHPSNYPRSLPRITTVRKSQSIELPHHRGVNQLSAGYQLDSEIEVN